VKRIRTWLIRIGLALLVVVIALTGVGTWVVRRSWPQVDGTVAVPGVLAPVKVIRDQWGVPHIRAQNEHDLFFAQGYVHAQDRLWQMEVNRRLGSGTLSEVVGESTVDLDRYMRTLGLRRIAEQSWQELDGGPRSILEAYAEGVNAYIQSHRGRLSLEFTILGVTPEPWTPIDSLTWGNTMALSMGLNAHAETLHAWAIAELGKETMQQLFLSSVKDTPVIVPTEVNDYSWLRNERFDSFASVDEWRDNAYLSWGSNNWVVHGSRTTTGEPILSNDTHLDLLMPSAWYENGLHGGRFDSIGFTFPGVPLITIGRNQHIAWGITNLDPDVQDVYVERLDDLENPTQYLYMGEWRDLDVIQETIIVRGNDPVKFNILLTQHGPLINDIFRIPGETQFALRWTLYEGSVVFKALASVNLATNWDEFRASLRHWDSLGQNFVYADIEGNIGYQAAGKIPIRAPDHQGVVPVPGWTGEYEWQGYIPFDELPTAFNPPAGFIVTANNDITTDDYDHMLTYDWYHPGYRARRITDLLATGDHFTVEDMQNIQAETYSLPAKALRPYLLEIEPENGLQAKALALVEAWDLRLEMDSVGASIYETWYLFMLRNTLGDDLGEALLAEYQRNPDEHVPMMSELMADADHAWFDDVNTPQVETRDDIVRHSLADALDWLSERYGKDPDGWEWGRMHTIIFAHTPLGQSGIAPLERLFNSSTVPVPGGQFSVNTAAYGELFQVFFGTSQRMIVDLSDPGNMLTVNSTGQSEHLFHAHREDQVSMWRDVEYRSVPLTWEAIEANAKAILTLAPE
jgi:penicillin amidase